MSWGSGWNGSGAGAGTGNDPRIMHQSVLSIDLPTITNGGYWPIADDTKWAREEIGASIERVDNNTFKLKAGVYTLEFDVAQKESNDWIAGRWEVDGVPVGTSGSSQVLTTATLGKGIARHLLTVTADALVKFKSTDTGTPEAQSGTNNSGCWFTIMQEQTATVAQVVDPKLVPVENTRTKLIDGTGMTGGSDAHLPNSIKWNELAGLGYTQVEFQVISGNYNNPDVPHSMTIDTDKIRDGLSVYRETNNAGSYANFVILDVTTGAITDSGSASGPHELRVYGLKPTHTVGASEKDQKTEGYKNAGVAHAEAGLDANDNYVVKVSPDGAAWKTAVTIDKISGKVGFGIDTPVGGVQINNSSGLRISTPGAPAGYYTDFVQQYSAAEPFYINVKNYGKIVGVKRLNEGSFTDSTVYQSGVRGVHWETNGGFRAGITQDGKFGIGTTSPQSMLDVNGGIRPKAYTVLTVPDAAANGHGTHIFVVNGSKGAVPAYSDGANWKWFSDDTIIS